MICFMGVVPLRTTPTTWQTDPSLERGGSQALLSGYAARRAAAAAAAPKPYSYSTSYAGPSVLSVKRDSYSLSSVDPSKQPAEPYFYPRPYKNPSVQSTTPENEGSIETLPSVPPEKAYSWEIGVPEESWGAPNGVWNDDNEHEADFDLSLNDVRERSSALPSFANSSASSENLMDISGTKMWLSSLPDTVCYDAIIDAYRLRVEDEYVLTGKVEVGSLYAHDFPLAHFILFIELARREDILPDTWSPKRSVACQQIALDEDGDACILHAVDKDYIRDKYKNSDPIVVDVLRMVADKAYGRALFSSGLRFFSGGELEGGWWA